MDIKEKGICVCVLGESLWKMPGEKSFFVSDWKSFILPGGGELALYYTMVHSQKNQKSR